MIITFGRGGKEIGNYPEEAVPALLQAKVLQADDFFWYEGLSEWAPVHSRWPNPAPVETGVAKAKKHQNGPTTLVRSYKGNQSSATAQYQKDAAKMSDCGYYPTSQVWAPGSYGCGSFLFAALLCIVLIGVIVFIYMLIVKPEGTLTVTYQLHR